MGIVVALFLSGCVASEPAEETGSTGITAAVEGGEVTVSAPELPEDSLTQLAELGDLGGVFVSVPVELASATELPDSGAVLRQEYAAPLPEDSAATFIYWDDDWAAWRAVPSELSSDRRVLTAVVDHFSLWSAIVATTSSAAGAFGSAVEAAGSAVADGAAWVASTAAEASKAAGELIVSASDTLYRIQGELLSVRADAPICDGSTPSWVDSAVFIEDHDANPVRFCVGGTGDQFQVKAVVNRGYGAGWTSPVPAGTVTNSSGEMSFDYILDSVTELDSVLANSVTELVGAPGLVLPGETLTLTYSRDAANQSPAGEPLLRFDPPRPAVLAVSVLANTVTKLGLGMGEGAVFAAVAAASCGRASIEVDDVASVVSAISTCVQSADDAIAKNLSVVLLKLGYSPQSAGSLAGKILGRFSVYTALFSALSVSLEGLADSNLPDAARTVTVYVKPAADEGWVISTEGVGPLRFGMPRDEATAATDWDRATLMYEGCPAYSFMLGGQHLRAHVLSDWGAGPEDPGDLWYISYTPDTTESPTARTAEGIGIGSTEADLQAAYGTKLAANTDLSTQPFSFMGLRAIYILDDGTRTINFAVGTDGIVHQIDVGEAGSKWVMYEACG